MGINFLKPKAAEPRKDKPKSSAIPETPKRISKKCNSTDKDSQVHKRHCVLCNA